MSDFNAMREPIWPERDVNGKLEALRQQVLHLISSLDACTTRLDKLLTHQHSMTGNLFVPLSDGIIERSPGHYVPMGLRDQEQINPDLQQDQTARNSTFRRRK